MNSIWLGSGCSLAVETARAPEIGMRETKEIGMFSSMAAREKAGQTFAEGWASYKHRVLQSSKEATEEERGSLGMGPQVLAPSEVTPSINRYPTHTQHTTIPSPNARSDQKSARPKTPMDYPSSTIAKTWGHLIPRNPVYWICVFATLASIVWLAELIG